MGIGHGEAGAQPFFPPLVLHKALDPSLLAAFGFILHQKSRSCQHSESLTESIYTKKSIRFQSLLLFLAPAAPQAHLAPMARGTHPQTSLGTAQTGRGENALTQWSPHTCGGFSILSMMLLHLCKQPSPKEGPEEKRVSCACYIPL